MSRPRICLTMIVRDEAHVIGEAIASLAPHISAYCIVDTGSTDETIAVIEQAMGELDIEGRIHERPWRDFASNRTEAIELAAEQDADYMWMFDADDLLVGTLDLGSLSADSYLVHCGSNDFRYWRKQIFRSSPRWCYRGVVHEYPTCLDPASEARLEGEYLIESRRLGARSGDPHKYYNDAELLAAELKRDPDDSRSAFYLAQSLSDAGEPEAALAAYEQRAAMEGFEEEAFYSELRAGAISESLGEPWERSLSLYLAAHERRPLRAEPLHDIARHYRIAGQPNLAYLFASRAATTPLPGPESLFVHTDAYTWRSLDELSIAAANSGRSRESYELCEELLNGSHLPESERDRVEANRDLAVPAILEETAAYPEAIVARLSERRPPSKPEVTMTITSCRRPRLLERTLNSFLSRCTDVERVGRFICVDNGSNSSDLSRIADLYPFLEIVEADPDEARHAGVMNRILERVDSPYWLQMEDDWHFFRSGPYVGEALSVLAAEPQLGQLAFNRNYAETLEDRRVAGAQARATPGGLRYRLHEWVPLNGPQWPLHIASLESGQMTNAHWPHFTLRPSLIRREMIEAVGRFDESVGDFELEFAGRYAAAGARTGFLDRICCVHTGRLTTQRPGEGPPSAYELLGPSSAMPGPTHREDPSPPASEQASTPVLVLNLDRRPDRWSAFQEMLRDSASERTVERVRRVAAIDGTELELDDEIRGLFSGNDFGWRRGMIGAALTHISAWREVVEGGRATLIVEDDATLGPGFDQRLAELERRVSELEAEPDLVLLGYCGPRRWGGPGGRPDDLEGADEALWPMRWERYWGGTFAYLLSPAGAASLLALAERDGVRNGIDVFVRRHAAEIDAYECVPALATTPLADPGSGVDSDIQHDHEPLRGAEAIADDGPVALAGLAEISIGSLALDPLPGRPVAEATMLMPGPDGELRILAATGETDGAEAESYLVRLNKALEVESVEPLPGGEHEAAGGFDLDGEGVLSLSADDVGAHRFVLTDAAGGELLRSPPFRVLGDGERCGGVARSGDHAIAVFSSSEGARFVSIELDELRDLLEPVN